MERYRVEIKYKDGTTQNIECQSYCQAKKTLGKIIYGNSPEWDGVTEASLIEKACDKTSVVSKKKKYSIGT